METWLSICVGIGLSAACGFRVFVPPLFLSVAALTGQVQLSPGFAWLGTYPALIAFAVAATVEVAGYFIPWVDHALDSLASPAAVVAGTMLTASLLTDLDPFLKWTLALIAGGGAAGVVQGLTVGARGVSSATTAGLGNPMLATAELGGSVATSLISLTVPALGVVVVLLLCAWLGRRWMQRRPAGGPGPAALAG